MYAAVLFIGEFILCDNYPTVELNPHGYATPLRNEKFRLKKKEQYKLFYIFKNRTKLISVFQL